jgi:hypothetical protein
MKAYQALLQVAKTAKELFDQLRENPLPENLLASQALFAAINEVNTADFTGASEYLVGQCRGCCKCAIDSHKEFENWISHEIAAGTRIAGNPYHEIIENCVTYLNSCICEFPADDTKGDTKKNNSKKRPKNTAAIDCGRRFKAARKEDPTITRKQVVSEYVEEFGGSIQSIERTLVDYPELWKDDTETT